MEKTRLNLQWLSKGKSIRKRDLKQIGSYQSATQQPALATKWGAPTTQRGLWSLVPSQLLWAWLLHQTARLNCLWSTLPILPRANISSLQESSQDPVCQSEWDLPVFQLSWPFWRNLWVPTCWALSGLRSSSGKCKQRNYHASRQLSCLQR